MPALPAEFIDNMQKLLGDETPAFLRALEEPPALALRLNPKRRGAEDAARAFTDGPVPWARRGRYLKPLPDARPGASVLHAAGAFYLQEASAMASAAVLDARPGERVLDLCAAPGGKSTQIAAAMADRGLLISNDPEASRAKALAGNLERMGAANAVVVSALPRALADRWPGRFDAVLVDAPCSGEGMFRRDPAARNEWTSASPAGCARRQAEILDCAAALVRPGGRLVYSTCTFNDVENEGSVLGFLDRHPDFAPEVFALDGVGEADQGMLRLMPHRLRGDGHFVAKLRKASAPDPAGREAPSRPGRKDPAAMAAMAALEREACPADALPPDMALMILGDRLIARPACCPDPGGLRVMLPGLCLARLGRSHVEPEHALAMAVDPEAFPRRAELDAIRAQAWLRGEALPWEGERGWTLVTHLGMPLGWGKASEGVLKNHLPKGLRRPG